MPEDQINEGTPSTVAGNMVSSFLASINPTQQVGPQPQTEQQTAPAPMGMPPEEVVSRVLSNGTETKPVEEPVQEAEPDPFVDKPTDGKPDDIGHKAFAQLRYDNKILNGKISEYEDQLNQVNEKMALYEAKIAEMSNQIADREQQLSAVEDELGRSNLAESKEFQDRFDGRVMDLHGQLAKIITDKTNVTDADKADKVAMNLLSMDEKSALKSVEQLPSYVQGAIYNILREAKTIEEERNAALDDWRASKVGISEAEARRKASDLAQRRQKMSASALSAFNARKDILALQDPRPDHVKEREELANTAMAFVQTATEEDLANAAVEGVMASMSYKLIEELQRQVADLRGQLGAVSSFSSPPVRATHSGYTAPTQYNRPVTLVPPSTTKQLADDIARSALLGLK